MNVATLSDIENSITQLSLSEQLRLMEYLARRIRQQTSRSQDEIEDGLAAMANDPHIQKEIKQINEEFAVTEMDGLETA